MKISKLFLAVRTFHISNIPSQLTAMSIILLLLSIQTFSIAMYAVQSSLFSVPERKRLLNGYFVARNILLLTISTNNWRSHLIKTI